MATLSPEFVNWDDGPARGVGGGMFERRSRHVTDLHVVFEKGGVTLKNSRDFKSTRATTTEENAWDLELKDPGLESQIFHSPSLIGPDGALTPPANEDTKKGHKVVPEFERNGTEPPRIKAWWWTHKHRRSGPEYLGHADNLPVE